MVEIFSKQDGPRREDARIKHLIQQNQHVITKLADQISGGHYSESKKPKLAPQAEGLIIHIGGSAKPAPEPEPKIRITPNGRVIAVDVSSGLQLHYIGELRERRGLKMFALATTDNGFIAPLDETMIEALADIDGVALGPAYDSADLAADIGLRLNIPSEA
ncbi:hypothetical protein ACXHXG_14760 [Rhizobium sp. LEGMi198b]|uniref:hypothetical protein n=1 Tax=unclassified Rhizobium TaxID=2613769 RepID=UPI0021A4D828|nr:MULTISPECIES: hypothetical protein [Rhizobium]MDK4742941.1 hypothetical protein [Rhizobium sp. CNPSo 3464]UWU24301.1 hypothetical protein N2601_29265 [Rhizobium tropici]WFU05284.1 hypothetical protein QA648_31735 [Rhizobium sp. CB3171]